MAAKRDLYEVLGLNKNADAAAIKKAYRKLAKKYHPDINAGNPSAGERFKEINEAYEVLGNEEKKRLYDTYGFLSLEPGFSEEAMKQQRQNRNFHFETEAGEDYFQDLFGDLFGAKAGFKNMRGRSYRGYTAKGQDIEADVKVDFEEAVLGCDKTFSIQDPVNGSTQSIRVHIPAGVDTGSKVRLKGKGGSGISGGANGDLYLKISVADKQGYERKGLDIYSTVCIPYTTAVLGGEARIHTFYGDVVCNIKEGTQPGTKIRLKGKGVVSMKNKAVRGDQYAVIQILVPRNLKPDAKEKLREYQRVSMK